MLTRTVYLRKCTAVHPESTPREVTRIRYPIDRITYLENFLCQTNKPSVLFEISYLLLFPSGDNSVRHTQINTNYHIHRKKTFHFKTYRLFMFGIFTSVQIPPGGICCTSLFSRERIAGGEWSPPFVPLRIRGPIPNHSVLAISIFFTPVNCKIPPDFIF